MLAASRLPAAAAAGQLGLILAFLTLTYLPTILYPYLLLDETWIFRTDSLWWGYAFGRPFFSVISWPAAKLFWQHGFVAIYAIRAAAILGLGLSAYFMAAWLQRWGHDRWSAVGLAVAAMTLPAYQIVVADGTQLAFGVLAAILAMLALDRGFEHRSLLWLVCAGALVGTALLIYQQQALISFALLAVPLIRRPGERGAQGYVLAGGAFLTLATVFYFASWRILLHLFRPDRIDLRYGPDAVRVPDLIQAHDFVAVRLPQVANLWNVNSGPAASLIVGLVALLIVLKAAHDLWVTRGAAMASLVLLGGLVVAVDSFRLLAHAYDSYVTATALGLLIFYWAFSGAEILWRSRGALPACAIAMAGGTLAFVTVRSDIAIPNWMQTQQIEQGLVAHKDALNFTILGTPSGGPHYQEFGWRNGPTDGYLYLLTIDIADDLAVKHVLSPEQRENMYVAIQDTPVHTGGDIPNQPRPGSVSIQVS